MRAAALRKLNGPRHVEEVELAEPGRKRGDGTDRRPRRLFRRLELETAPWRTASTSSEAVAAMNTGEVSRGVITP